MLFFVILMVHNYMFFPSGVVWTFFIFWILMYILMIMFLVGGLLYTNVCRNLNKGVEHVAVSTYRNIAPPSA